jgi:hypothetical protein
MVSDFPAKANFSRQNNLLSYFAVIYVAEARDGLGEDKPRRSEDAKEEKDTVLWQIRKGYNSPNGSK